MAYQQQDKRERVEGRERKERSGSGTRQQPNLELQLQLTTTPNYLPMESTTHKSYSQSQNIFFIQYNVQFLSSPYKN
jgi:hypothetical protein